MKGVSWIQGITLVGVIILIFFSIFSDLHFGASASVIIALGMSYLIGRDWEETIKEQEEEMKK